jgi:uncharacterized lipoprotein YmbA
MMRRTSAPTATHQRLTWPLALALLAAGGCGLLRGPNVQPTKFYVLTALSQPDASPPGRRLVIGLGPVHLPDYLNRPEMVSRVEENQLRFDQVNRWGEPLKDNFVRVVASNLDTLLHLDHIVPFPWYSNTPMDYTVVVNVLRFEPQPSGEVLLSVRWGIGDGKGHAFVSRDSHFTRPGGSPAETAAALSELLAELSSEIAGGLGQVDSAGTR